MKNTILYRKTLFILLLFMIVTTIAPAFAIWDYGVMDSESTQATTVTVGTWTQAPNGIDAYSDTVRYDEYDLVWFEGGFYVYRGDDSIGNEPSIENDWTFLNDLNWYDNITYRSGDVVYHNGIVYQATGYNNDFDPSSGGTNNPWTNMKNSVVAWHTDDPASTGDIYYHEGQLWINMGDWTNQEPGSSIQWKLVGDLTYNSVHIYRKGSIVEYNGSYYVSNWYVRGTTPSNTPYGAWTQITMSSWSSSIANGTSYVSHNGLIYEALVSNITTLRNNEPGTASSKGVWQAISTQEWQPYNTYSEDDLVMYNGSVYILKNATNSSVTPGTQANSWNLMDTMLYDAFNTYSVGEFAVINDIVYEVVNATNANNYAPGTYANAWNRLTGYEWYWYNVYEVGDVVYHEDGVYVSLSSSTNIEPGTSGSEAYWGYYNEN